MSKDIKIMELIPINHEYADTENSVLVHFARLRNLNIEGKSVNEIMYVYSQPYVYLCIIFNP